MSEALNIVNDTNVDSKFRRLLDLIPSGEKNAVSMKYLSVCLGMSVQAVRQYVQDARISGNIIARSQAGYFIPETLSELNHYYCYSKARALTNLTTLKAVRAILKQYE